VADTSRIDDLRRRLEKEPGSRLFAQLAEELRKEGELTEAIRVARTGLLQHPAYPSAHMTLGRALRDTGDLPGARVQFEAVLRGAPDNILASRFLGETLEAIGDLGSALLQYRATLRLAPGDRQIEGQIRSLEERLSAPTQRKTAPPPAARAAGPPVVAPPLPSSLTEMPPTPLEPHVVEAPPLPLPGGALLESAPAAEGSAPPLPVSGVPFAPASEISFDLEAPFESATATPAPHPGEPQVEARPLPAAGPRFPPAGAEAPSPSPSPPRFTPPSEASFDLEAPFDTAVGPAGRESGRGLGDEAAVETQEGPPAVAADISLEGLSPTPEPALTLETQPPAPPPPALSSSTLAELYFNQGFLSQAVEVYKELLQREPENQRVRTRLAEIANLERASGTMPAPAGPAVDPRAERRRVLEQTIARFENMLAAIKRG